MSLSLVQGDVRDRARVETVVAGQDAVLSALGTNQRGPVSLCTDGIERILTGMTRSRVRRLLVVSAYGAAESHHHDLYNFLLHITSHISRADVADFMLQRITDTASVRKALALTA
jgi:putative NADH-flavin reductase